ncbi:MAG: outer membrane beta-barrel protein [Longimicrobiales bacterium]
MRLAWCVRFVLVALALLPAAGQAQSNGRPANFWFSGGVGGGWARVSCAICRGERDLGAAGYLRVGVSIKDGILLGAEGNAWTRDLEENGREWVRGVTGVGYLYPRPGGSFYVKAGVGYLGYRAEDEEDEIGTGSIGVQLGAGYEFRIGSNLHITNYMNLLTSSFGKLRSEDDVVVDDVSVTLLQIGVGLTRR